VITSTSAGCSFTDTQAAVAFASSLDGSACSVSASSITCAGRSDDLARLGLGLHSVSVEATDADGSVSHGASCSWTVVSESGGSFTILARARRLLYLGAPTQPVSAGSANLPTDSTSKAKLTLSHAGSAHS
jgi:hypothetical protein